MSHSTSGATSAPEITIVIPVYNEEAILEAAVKDLLDRLAQMSLRFELLLAENGSTDRTVEIAEALSQRFPEVRHFSLGEPNYGKALRRGILEARGEFVLCDEIDLCDSDFYARALPILRSREADLVIGSKVMEGASDERPLGRHMATLVINGMLRVSLGFRGTDTHGLKAMRRAAMLGVVQRCVVDKDLFASEMVIRAERDNVPIKEIPVRVLEKRAPSIHLFKRVPAVLKGIARLVVAIRIKST